MHEAELGIGPQRWQHSPDILEDLKAKARQLGLWNMFLPKNHYSQGAGFTNLEYGLMAEYLGKSKLASEATNNSAPDTGNMEVLAKYGNEQQKAQYLAPLLDGKIRSAFLMTEPDVGSSDATNIQLNIRREGGEYVLNGSVCVFRPGSLSPVGQDAKTKANHIYRNGGLLEQETQDARSTWSWVNPTQPTKTPTASNP